MAEVSTKTHSVLDVGFLDFSVEAGIWKYSSLQTNVLGKYSTRDLPRENTILTYSRRAGPGESFLTSAKRASTLSLRILHVKRGSVNKGVDETLSSEDVWPRSKVQYGLELQDLFGDSGGRGRVH